MNNSWIASARALARQLHKGQIDKAGVDYFEGHLSTVASMGHSWQEQVCGYLHDASEDTPHTVEEILELLEKEAKSKLSHEDRHLLAIALNLLNHRKAPDRTTYIKNIGANSLARAVKLNDLRHNMDLSRLPLPTPQDLARIERYQREYDYLLNSAAH